MIPSMPAFMGQGLAIREQPSRTYGMNMEDGTVQGYVDGLEAMRQWPLPDRTMCRWLLYQLP